MNEKSLRVLEYGKIIEMLYEKCTSSLGRQVVEEMRPSTDLEEIIRLQKETSEAQGILMQKGNVPIDGIHDIIHMVKRTEIGSYLDPGQLLTLKDSLSVARRMKAYMKNDGKDVKFPIIEDLVGALFSLREIEEKISNCILSENEIADNASPQLRDIRRSISSKNDSIRNKLNGIISSTNNQKYLQDAIITMRGDRYVVPVKQEHRGNFPGLIHDQSSSGATLFIEPMAVVELNNELKELRLKEKREIERILMEISAMIADKAYEIKSNQKLLQQLDFIFAKGKLSITMKAIEPKLNADGKIKIKRARHPLLQGGEVVPITIWLGEGFKTLIITGPNTGGKTVTLKTVGLLTVMAQSGLHVPADFGTSLSVFQQVYADIGDEQSIEQSLSTFSSHMTNIVDILNNVTPNSLVLFDELGAGTDPVEGAALAMAILNHLRTIGSSVIATTHYSELKQFALSNEDIENASVEFSLETLRPTYKLLIGVPGKSNAFEISRKLGLTDDIISAAKEFISTEDIHFEDILQNIETNRRATEEDREEAKRLKLESEKLFSQYQEKKQQIDTQRDKVLKEAKKEAQKLLKEAKEEAEEIIKSLREMKLEMEEKEMNRQVEIARKKLSDRIDDMGTATEEIFGKATNKKPPTNLKAGEAVNILSLNQQGHVITPADENGEVLVQAGIMKISMHISNLERVKQDKSTAKQSGVGKIVKNKAQSIKRELDIRGYNLEEAMLEVDKFLDDCYLTGMSPVTIIHGVGTGILSSGIKQMLKKNKHVKSYRGGQYGEGGAGVTVVEVK
ncbi:endonuclease MutS2 [Alkaliphilus serpentinus]|uniref:Endonuclease MutS2 n=1 Tax=Alkaliphilus serpentinus TaxID=1482731 RepID=A0A833HNA6_9FIRM|nr:endonuclease MutS2 [Alkaliphilus serpentinus]KAB3529211.1 endonuclease MutS2 [Alkaliphilus serpentinus]